MLFEEQKSILYSDTLVPDVFISEYLPAMEGDFVKIYVYWRFIGKYSKKVSIEDMAKILGLDNKKLEAAIEWFVLNGLISKGEKGYILNDLKEREIHKQYGRASLNSDNNSNESTGKDLSKRVAVIRTINNKFFQGVMPISWYNIIDEWFEQYHFDEDVMCTLFHHCFQKKLINNRNYIKSVAENWYRRGIRNIFQLDEYMKEYENMRKTSSKIANRLKLGRLLTVYEEEIVGKWLTEYKYSFDIIEIALKQTTSLTNPNFNYLDGILTNWYEKGLVNKNDILKYIENFKRTRSENRTKTAAADSVSGKERKAALSPAIPQKSNYSQRDYDDDFFDNLYYNKSGSNEVKNIKEDNKTGTAI